MNFNSTQFAAIVENAKKSAANHPEWMRRIEKAARMLQSGELCVTLFADGTALVTSPNGSYRVNGHCPCAARTAHCYHRAAKRLIEMMETAPAHNARTCEDIHCSECERLIDEQVERDIAAYDRRTLICEIKAAWPREWPPLAVELMRRR